VDASRLGELRSLPVTRFDLSKLVRLCEELNSSYANECYFAVAMLTRAVLDHVPPIFSCGTFRQVANNYKDGGRSFKKSMEHLENSSRHIADAHLHRQIGQAESLPNRTQVNFTNELDALLAEVARILKRTEDGLTPTGPAAVARKTRSV
jgi:hypothetical protein